MSRPLELSALKLGSGETPGHPGGFVVPSEFLRAPNRIRWAILARPHVLGSFLALRVRKAEFIRTGLWSRSRHPNYFGEIVIWLGVFITAAPVLAGWQWVAVLSPVFVILLLTRVSGIPLLEARAEKKWGERPDYIAYRGSTPVLIPRLFRKSVKQAQHA